MSSNRAALLTKTHKVLKKHYKPVMPPADRTVLSHLLYACCVENARPESADEAFAKLEETFFDWNEVRVTTVTDLAEEMKMLPDAKEAATRLKLALQAVFETHYQFDLEFLKKQNLGKAAKDLEGFSGVTPFVVNYVIQHGLGGHMIPVSEGALSAMLVIGAISDKEHAQKRVPGLERAVTKTKGPEFASLLQQLGAEYRESPQSPRVRNLLVEIAPEAKDRLPKRTASKSASKAPTTTAKKTDGSTADSKKAAKKSKPAKEVKAAKPAEEAKAAKKNVKKASKESAKATGKKASGSKKTSKGLAKKKPR